MGSRPAGRLRRKGSEGLALLQDFASGKSFHPWGSMFSSVKWERAVGLGGPESPLCLDFEAPACFLSHLTLGSPNTLSW